MAKAEVYFRFDGPDNSWQGPMGSGSSQQADGNTAADHAERQAWREAQKTLQAWYDQRRDKYQGQKVQVKIWVDQMVCPQCQLWMIAGVLRNLAAFAFKPELFVEVKALGTTKITAAVTRHYVWPADIGHAGCETLGKLRSAGVTLVD